MSVAVLILAAWLSTTVGVTAGWILRGRIASR
jgi:hypothetical protein